MRGFPFIAFLRFSIALFSLLAFSLAGCTAKPEIGTIRGIVKFSGPRPKPRVVDVAGAPYCQKCWEKEGRTGPISEAFVISDDGAFQNVLVWISDGAPTRQPPPTAEPVIVEFSGCRFVPHVSVATVGQPILFRNRDETLHSVHPIPRVNPEFSLGQPAKGMDTRFNYSKPEIGMLVKCDVHAWEYCFVHILPHSHFDITKPDGTFEIPSLPPGEYELAVWHEQRSITADRERIRVKVEAGKVTNASFVFQPKQK